MINFLDYSKWTKRILVMILCMALLGGSCTFSVDAEEVVKELIYEETEALDAPKYEDELRTDESQEIISDNNVELQDGYAYDPNNPNQDPEWGHSMGYYDTDIWGESEEYTFESTVEPGDEVIALGAYNTDGYTHNSRFNDMKVETGIDVSHHQGSINWSQVKQAGVDFTFIRVAYRGYGKSGSLNEDNRYKENISNAYANGIPVGVYIYSQATTEAEAIAEANYICGKIKAYSSKITLPVIMDFEYASVYNSTTKKYELGGRLYNAHLSKTQATNVCMAFCNTVRSSGYEPMLYANKSTLRDCLNASTIAASYQIWLANYTKKTDYEGQYKYWQFSDKGKIAGISEAVDLDFGYVKPNRVKYVINLEGAQFEGVTLDEENRQDYITRNGPFILPIPTCGKRIFEGWYRDSACSAGNEIMQIDSDVGDITVYGKWKDKEAAQAPVFSIPAGEVDSESLLEITSETRSGHIYYTFDPSKASTLGNQIGDSVVGIKYTDAIELSMKITSAGESASSGNITIYAVTVAEDFNKSSVTSCTYTINNKAMDWGDITAEIQALSDYPFAGVSANEIPDKIWMVGAKETHVYSGNGITQPNLKVFYGKKQLIINKEYSVKYKNNVKAGENTASIIVTPKGNYQGAAITEYFTIKPADLSTAYATGTKLTLNHNGKIQKGSFTLKYLLSSGKTATLKRNTDYTVKYIGLDGEPEELVEGAFINAGTYTIHITGRGNFDTTSGIDLYLDIIDGTQMGKLKYIISGAEYSDGESVFPTVKLMNGKTEINGFLAKNSTNRTDALAEYTTREDTENSYDYVYFCTNNKQPTSGAVVTFIGLGDNHSGYFGTISRTYKISGINLKKAKVEPIPACTYDGTQQTPSVIVNYGDDTLVEGTDYVTSYTKNISKGTGRVSIMGINKYSGTINKTFSIAAYDITENVAFNDELCTSSIKIILSTNGRSGINEENGEYIYPYMKSGVKPAVQVRFKLPDGIYKELVAGTDYTISYSSPNRVGTSVIKIKGRGSFKGQVNQTYQIENGSILGSIISAPEVVYQRKGNIFKVTPTIVDSKGAKLVKNRDFYIESYSYAEDVRVGYKSGTRYLSRLRQSGDVVDGTDIIPADTKLTVSVRGKGYYKDELISVNYSFVQASLSACNVVIKPAFYIYNGKAIRPNKEQVKVYYKYKELDPADYRISGYTNNINAGNAKISLSGTGNFGGGKTATFRIYKLDWNSIL